MIYCIIKNNYVVSRIVADDIKYVVYPFEYDLIIEDAEGSTHIGDWYEEDEKLFYRPVGIPPDWPDKLIPNDEEFENE